MEDQVHHLDVDIVPNGVDTEDFFHVTREKSKNPIILFVGNFKWLQNKEAVSILVTKIWPEVIQKLPQARLWIVGRFPTPEIKNYENKTIKVFGNVDDIKNVYKKADILLAPIYGPGGTRYKILEAMASGIPVVTTNRGIEGLRAIDGTHALVRDDSQSLADATVELITDKSLYDTLAKNGKKLISENYDWKKISLKLDELYENVSKSHT